MTAESSRTTRPGFRFALPRGAARRPNKNGRTFSQPLIPNRWDCQYAPMPLSSVRRIPIPAGELEVEIHGTGPSLLLVPGLGGRRQFWRQQLRELAKHFRVILHDHRGTGGSSKWRGPFSVAQMAGDVLALMDELAVSSASMVGHSTGGAVVQHLLVNASERVERAILSATWAAPDEAFLSLFDVRRQLLSRAGVEAYLTDGTLRAVPPSWLATRVSWLGQTRDERLKAFPGKATELARIDAVMAHNLESALAGVRRDVTIVVAEDDQITPPHLSATLHRLLRGSELRSLPSGGHFVPLTEPRAYNQTLLNALET